MTEDPGLVTWRRVVFPDEAGARLDRFLAAASGMSRRGVRRWVAERSCRVNGASTGRLGRELRAGDVVELPMPETGPPSADRVPPEVTILHEDDWLLALDKPPGVLSQPIRGSEGEELAMDERALLFLAFRDGARPRLRLVHRLDRVTSGVLLLAKQAAAHGPLARAWRRGEVERRYLAIVEGIPSFEEVTIREPIARDPDAAWRFRVDPGGRPAETRIRRIAEVGEGRARVECRLRTGRTHQVRVHLSHLGHPVAGDGLYGGDSRSAPRALLHAASLRLPHPRDGRELGVEAPDPDDFS